MLIETLGAARDMGRLNTILGVLIRHGFGDSVRRLGLADRLERAGHVLKWEHAADLARLEPPVQLRLTLEELGPTFVKLGQILAGRADLFGPDYIAEFEKLHSQVPAVPLDILLPQLREDLGGEPETLFARFDTEPLAAASIAQVHRAQLHDGTEVVVKIRRPGITETIEADLRLLARLAAIAEAEIPALKPYRPQQLVRELARSLKRELDLASECRNAERIAANLASLPWIVVPKVHWAHTKERVNVQDFVHGTAGNQLDQLDALGLDRSLLAKRGAQAVLKQIVEDGLFHADPHPGNVIYLEDNRIAFIDFGMVGRLSVRRREELLNLLLGLVERNPQTVADVLLDWTGDEHGVNLSLLETEIETFVDQYHGVPLAQLNLGEMLADVTTILREHHLGLPSDMALLIKAFITLEGMGRGLDPEFHMTTEALPLLKQVVRARYQPKVVANRAWQTLRRTLAVAEQLPHDVSRLLRNARRGKVHVGIELAHLKRVGDQIDRAANRLTMALVIAALIIGSSIVMTVKGGPTLFGLPAFGFLGFASAFVGGLWLVRAIWRSSKGRDVGEE
ncbi:MAG TPA: ubiquinone biosynthesis protein UbiB [Hydrogenophaga sp.]|uniref:ABC1 kinase family protein n=1 Tax=Hydrogenophaga sp. TaxID=1904254 RepID=UPI0008BB3730|nr:AarF/UbiB family protein [Hydrogenophaga sp.]OGA79272.1 MAG: ubiquinone biosynthesis protein UbiB [Burkholderiales bacterium GWE1_65_30]OGA92216.1 MAG: ubiquinone biosynthesis protein UbiB [Burkholderiales bacterium GWF1_66_17]HAX21490.1 ubiquinone biosynthesis protein UbiB [Hydrogenophaga sp.]HBU17869.1 ubiquinone biosynthesis protein UbiB [Hydrogenophaga sp.]